MKKPTTKQLKSMLRKIDLVKVSASVCSCGCSCSRKQLVDKKEQKV